MMIDDIPRLRRRQDDDGLPIGVVVRNRYRDDHVFERGDADKFGFHISRLTRRSFNSATGQYRNHLHRYKARIDDEILGETDGVIKFTTSDPGAIPEWFKKPAGKIAAGRAKAAIRLAKGTVSHTSGPEIDAEHQARPGIPRKRNSTGI